MSAAKIEIDWMPDGFERASLNLTLVRNITQPTPHLRCPECRSIIYTRRHRLCAVCGQELPEHMLFSTFEADRVQKLLEEERLRHRAWMSK